MTDNGGTGHILVVDDDPDIRELVIEALVDEGFSAAGACDGVQALAYLDGGPRPDLILLDLMMPNMDGFQFREAQLKNPRHADIPVALFTADRLAKDKADQLGVAGVAQKPLKVEALFELLRRVLAAR